MYDYTDYDSYYATNNSETAWDGVLKSGDDEDLLYSTFLATNHNVNPALEADSIYKFSVELVNTEFVVKADGDWWYDYWTVNDYGTHWYDADDDEYKSVSSLVAWSRLTTYSIGDIVLYEGVVYKSLKDSNNNEDPDTKNSTYWTKLSDIYSYSSVRNNYNIIGADGGSNGTRVTFSYKITRRELTFENPNLYFGYAGTVSNSDVAIYNTNRTWTDHYNLNKAASELSTKPALVYYDFDITTEYYDYKYIQSNFKFKYVSTDLTYGMEYYVNYGDYWYDLSTGNYILRSTTEAPSDYSYSGKFYNLSSGKYSVNASGTYWYDLSTHSFLKKSGAGSVAPPANYAKSGQFYNAQYVISANGASYDNVDASNSYIQVYRGAGWLYRQHICTQICSRTASVTPAG